jgi:NAD(P)-dependent dehydrogenase (short-subunit alcohol dehydrogenase family)
MQPVPDYDEHSYPGSGRLRDRRALITGGGSGMGRTAAIGFAREGADVAINCRQKNHRPQEVAALIAKAERKAVLLLGNIRDEEFCKRLVADATDKLGGLESWSITPLGSSHAGLAVEFDFMNPRRPAGTRSTDDARAGSMKPGKGALTPMAADFRR